MRRYDNSKSRIMDLNHSVENEQFEADVRAFLDEAFTPNLRAEAARETGVFAHPDLGRRWHRILFEKGWVAPSWPVEHGGPGWTAEQRHIFFNECAMAGTPTLPAMGLGLCGPVLMRFGTPEQKARFLPRILSGDDYWCQGYSEPQSGSDLTSLKMSAVLDGEEYVVNGSKIWTTHAQFANWIFLLVRTDPDAKPQRGISFLLCPMDAPGITVSPIISMSGEHEVNQVFFDNVRIPVANRVGEENAGWSVAKYLLEFERGGGFYGAKLLAQLDAIKFNAAGIEASGVGTVLDDPDFRRKLIELEIDVLAADWTERRLAFGQDAGESLGNTAASLKKLVGSELSQRVSELAVDMIGPYVAVDYGNGAPEQTNQLPVGPECASVPMMRYLNNRAITIFGGTSEVQRNILARHVLG